GNIISDRANVPENTDNDLQHQTLQRTLQKKTSTWRSFFDRLGEAFRMALLAMNAHRMRTFLTMLGIIIGIASVVSVVALGNG
ncbi:macrolide ABC transporter permease/ATP-binding protein MacB, partial [Acinetobacter johnsonii]